VLANLQQRRKVFVSDDKLRIKNMWQSHSTRNNVFDNPDNEALSLNFPSQRNNIISRGKKSFPMHMNMFQYPKNQNIDKSESTQEINSNQDAKIFDTEVDSGRSRFPEQGLSEQVDDPQGVVVTGDRGIVTRPDTMFATAPQGNNGPLQDNGLVIAMTVNEDDDEMYLPVAAEYEPDAKPPIYLNRRFRLYMSATICLFFVVTLTIIVSIIVLRGRSSTSLENAAPTFFPTSLQESSYLQQFALSLGYQEWQFIEDALYYKRAAKWIMEEDERKLSVFF
jgi:hypothetical protein